MAEPLTTPPRQLQPLSDSEIVIYARLLSNGGTSTAGELTNRRYKDGREWNYAAVGIFLDRMRDKGWVTSSEDPEKSNRLLWHATIPAGETLALELEAFLTRVACLPIPAIRSQLLTLLKANAERHT